MGGREAEGKSAGGKPPEGEPVVLTLADARSRLGDLVVQIEILGSQYVITRYGRPVARLIPFGREAA